MRPANYLFVSDLHLDASLPQAVEQFLGFLAGEARTAEGLYILGDLFEAWVGDDDPEPCRSRVCDALHRYTQEGHGAWVVRGNRDFLFGSGFEARTGCVLLPDPVRVTIGAFDAFVSHGDVLCTDDHAYQALRSIVRRPQWQERFKALPLAARRAIADAARAGSRAHTGRTTYEVMDVNTDVVVTALRVTGTRLMVHGHTHRPGIHELTVDGERATRIVLGDWYTQGSVLRVYDDGRYTLVSLPRETPQAPRADSSTA